MYYDYPFVDTYFIKPKDNNWIKILSEFGWSITPFTQRQIESMLSHWKGKGKYKDPKDKGPIVGYHVCKEFGEKQELRDQKFFDILFRYLELEVMDYNHETLEKVLTDI